MDTRRYGEVSVRHLEPETYAKLLHLAATGPGRPGGARYDPEDPWHALIVEPHTYGCWVHTGIVDNGDPKGLPASLLAVLREAHTSDAAWVLFDADLMPGQTIVFEEPAAVADGRSLDRLEVVKNRRSHRTVLFRDPEGGGLYRIPNVKRREYRLVDTPRA